jgi:hypothetical protein
MAASAAFAVMNPGMVGMAPPKYRYVRISRKKDGNDHWMNIAEAEVFAGGINVAKDKKVTQSSRFSGQFKPSMLIDGNKDNFVHTNNADFEWFLIDLGQEYEIEKVIITNRRSCCKHRLRNTIIELSKTVNGSNPVDPKGSRAITKDEAIKATITWDVKTDKMTSA